MSRLKNLLITLNAHEKYKHEIERLILAGKALPDVLIAYEFLYQHFGKMQELETLVQEKESGWTWGAVFAGYNEKHPDFVPRSFEPEYLERLMAMPGITPDDIMLADRISFVSETSVDALITDKLEAQRSWKQIPPIRIYFTVLQRCRECRYRRNSRPSSLLPHLRKIR